jgi:hypothetical protein
MDFGVFSATIAALAWAPAVSAIHCLIEGDQGFRLL